MRESKMEDEGWRIAVRGSRFLRFSIFYLLSSIFAAGCCCHPPVPATQPYIGPTDTMESVVAAINQNNQKIPTLWTQLSYSATIVDPEKKTTNSFGGDGGLMYAWPRSLLLNGNKDVVGQVFQLGSNNAEFWVKVRANADRFNYWWGHYANLGKPGCRPMPIRPDLVLQVLGVGLYGADFLQPPVPVMRFDNDQDVYVFDLNVPASDRWETSEEVWYDRQTKLPKKVLLYGDRGRVLLRADLSDYAAVENKSIAKEQWPKIARHYELFFPDSGSKITFDFIDTPQTEHRLRGGTIPRPQTFIRAEPDANDKVIQVDQNVNSTALAH
jgi:hypothetical protein